MSESETKDTTETKSDTAPDVEAPPARGITLADELPRDERGHVLGAWHVHDGPDTAWHLDSRLREPSIDGPLAERAIALGCSVLPGEDTRPRIELGDEHTDIVRRAIAVALNGTSEGAPEAKATAPKARTRRKP